MSGNTTRATRVANQMMPQGNIAKVLLYVARTDTGGPDSHDFTFDLTNNNIDQIQSVYIDNHNGDEPFYIQVVSSGQIVGCKAGSFGWFPLLVAYPSGGDLIFTGANSATPCFFCNVPMPVGQWSMDTDDAAGGKGVNPLAFKIAAGGIAVNAFNPPPSGGAVIMNPLEAAESLFVDIVNVAQVASPGTNGTTVELIAGGTFPVPPNFTGAVSVNAATTNHSFVAYGVGTIP